MRTIDGLLLKIGLGLFAAINLFTCIITTDVRVLVSLNIFVAVICFCIFFFIQAKFSALATDLGISKAAARKLVGDYFIYYKNVERITIDEYLEKSINMEKNGDDP